MLLKNLMEEGKKMGWRIQAIVRSNGRNGCCLECRNTVALADIRFQTGQIVKSPRCPKCIMNNPDAQARATVSAGIFSNPSVPLGSDVEFVRA